MNVNNNNMIIPSESESLELKSSFSKDVIETIVAFSNTRGGTIIIGCNDKREITGVSLSNESIQKWTNEIKQNTEPAVFPTFIVHKVEDKTIVSIVVDEFPLKPVAYRNRYFCRRQNANHLMTADEIAESRFLSLNYSFDAYPVNTKFNELDQTALDAFKKSISFTGRYIPSDNLKIDFEKLGLIIDSKLTRASQLLFGIHHTSIHIGRFKTEDTIIDDLVIRSPLILAVDEAMNFIKRNITLSYDFTGELKRTERWQYPLQAIREVLLNAVVHKDYTNPTDIIVKIFDERIEISNPGRFISGLTIADLNTDHYQPRHRNKLLAEVFYLTGDIEKYGTGFIRLRKWLLDYSDINFQLHDLNGFIKVEFSIASSNDSTPISTPISTPLPTVAEMEVLRILNENNRIIREDIAKQLNVSVNAIKRHIMNLKKKGLIKRFGDNRTGYWVIIDK